MTPLMPSKADRAFFFHLQGLATEWIALRLTVTHEVATALIRQGMERAAIKEAAE